MTSSGRGRKHDVHSRPRFVPCSLPKNSHRDQRRFGPTSPGVVAAATARSFEGGAAMSDAATTTHTNSAESVVAPKLPTAPRCRSRRRRRRASRAARCRSPPMRSACTPPRLPEDAPNILIVLIDDAGPGLPDDVRRRGAHRHAGPDLHRRGSATTVSTRPRCVRRRGRRC